MSPINPIQGSMPAGLSPGAARAGKQGASPAKTDFADKLRNYIDKVDNDQQVSTSAIQDLLSGKTQDILPTIAAVAKADMSFKLLIGIRNKVIEAYKQTMNMQV